MKNKKDELSRRPDQTRLHDPKRKSLQTGQPFQLKKKQVSMSQGAVPKQKTHKIQHLDIERLLRAEQAQYDNYTSQIITAPKDKENYKLSFRKSLVNPSSRRTSQQLIVQTAKTATLRPSQNNNNTILQFLQQQAHPNKSSKPASARPSVQPQHRAGKSLDYKRYLNKKMTIYSQKNRDNVKFHSMSHSCSPKKHNTISIQKLSYVPKPKTRPSSVRTTVGTTNISTHHTTQGNNPNPNSSKFNKSDNSTRLRQLLNTFKVDDSTNKIQIKEESEDWQNQESCVLISKQTLKKKPKTKKPPKLDLKISRQGLQDLLNNQRIVDQVCKHIHTENSLYYRLSSSRRNQDTGPDSQSIQGHIVNNSRKKDHEGTPRGEPRSSSLCGHLITESDDLDLKELRSFEKNREKYMGRRSALEGSHERCDDEEIDFHVNVIKKAWRRYRTKVLLQEYIDYFEVQREELDRTIEGQDSSEGDYQERVSSQLFLPYSKKKLGEKSRESSEISDGEIRIGNYSPFKKVKKEYRQQEECSFSDPIKIESQEFYKPQPNRRKITVISNLEIETSSQQQESQQQPILAEEQSTQQPQPSANYQDIIKHIKQEEMSKWNEIISIISSSIDQNGSMDTKSLLAKIAEQSQNHIRKLEKQVQTSINAGDKTTAARIQDSMIRYSRDRKSQQQQNKQEQSTVKKKQETLGDFHSLESSSSCSSAKKRMWSQDPFQKFNTKQYRELLNPSNVDKLMRSRQKMIHQRYRTEKLLLDQKYDSDQLSVNSYKRHCARIEQWREAQQHHMQQSRRTIEAGLGKAKDAIRKTQLDYIMMLRMRDSKSEGPMMKHSYSEEGLRNYIRHRKVHRNQQISRSRISELESESQELEIHNDSLSNSLTDRSAYEQMIENNKTIEHLERPNKQLLRIDIERSVENKQSSKLEEELSCDMTPPLLRRKDLLPSAEEMKRRLQKLNQKEMLKQNRTLSSVDGSPYRAESQKLLISEDSAKVQKLKSQQSEGLGYAQDFEEYEEQSNEEEDPRVLKRETNSPLHKPHLQSSSQALESDSDDDISYSEAMPTQRQSNQQIPAKDQEIESYSQEESSSTSQDQVVIRQQQSLELRFAKIMSKFKNPDELGESVADRILQDLLLDFLQSISTKTFIVENFKKIIPSQVRQQKMQAQIPKRAKGIKTTLASVKDYIRSLESFIINYQPEVMLNLQKPTGPSARELLCYMHMTEDDESPFSDNEQTNVIPGTVFEDHWRQIAPSLTFQVLYPNDPDRQKTRVEYLKGLTKIHNKALFECYNESLQRERNFGTFGEPFPWKHCAVFFRSKKNLETQQKSMEAAFKKVVGCATTYCGLIFDREEGPDYSEDYIAQVHDERMTRMLALDIIEEEEKWLFYTDEETETLVETGSLIFEELMREAIREVADIKAAREVDITQ